MISDQDIGAMLRTVRRQKGLSQRELAAKTGVANAMISLIENNRTNTTIAMLKRILDGFPMSLSEFFATDPEPRRQVFFRSDELLTMHNGRISFNEIRSGDKQQKLQILHERYAPGADTGRSMLQQEGEEGGFVISGRLEFTIGGETRILGPGDAYYYDTRLPHRIRNVGKDAAETISASTPANF